MQGICSALFYFMLKNEIYAFFLKVGHIVGKNVNNTVYLNMWKYIKGISVLANLVILIALGKKNLIEVTMLF